MSQFYNQDAACLDINNHERIVGDENVRVDFTHINRTFWRIIYANDENFMFSRAMHKLELSLRKIY